MGASLSAILTGIFFGLIVLLVVRHRRATKGADSSTGAGPAQASPQTVVAGAATASPSRNRRDVPATAEGDGQLSARLKRLNPALASAFDQSARPADLLDHGGFKEAVAALRAPEVPLRVVLQYAVGANDALAAAAFQAIAERGDAADARNQVLAALAGLNPWTSFCALRALRAADPTGPIGVPLGAVQQWWPDVSMMVSVLRDHLAEAASQGGEPGFGGALEGLATEQSERLIKLLEAIDSAQSRELLEQFRRWKQKSINRPLLNTFGRFLDAARDAAALVEFGYLTEPITLCESTLRATRPRSVVVVGEARSGKSSLIALVAARLQTEGYAVFQAGAGDIMAGQRYFGELEERVRVLVRELAIGKRVIWHVPDLLQLASAGRHASQPASILDQVLPALSAGEIVLVSEATPTQLERVLQANPTLRGLLQIARLRALSPDEIAAATREYVDMLHDRFNVGFAAGLPDDALQLARQYLGAQEVVGGVFDFLRLAATRVVAQGHAELTRGGLLDTLSQSTGLPRAILDETEPVALADVRRFFGARVMGQDAAVEAVVDRIAMLKAGLTDPGRPIAVFLFAGPTGTGKTELAKTLAEYLFGAPDRLIRLDMSELQTAEATRRILGTAGGDTESLTERVRKQPFCVVLLDEFEKAHPNAWDLFLQVFDDGRLTDANGQTVDFRHAFVILTTNLGATSHKGANLGFTAGSSAFNEEQVLRAVRQSFRPEFINRLDRVLVFRPLGRDLMRGILQKELARVLERRGLKSKAWAVEWESSAIEFLLDRGFSPDMGARPLRRAIDQHLLAPLAATLVEHRFPEGEQFLFVRSDGGAIQVEFVDPDAEPAPAAVAAPPAERVSGQRSLGAIILQPDGSSGERAVLRARLDTACQALASTVFDELTAGYSAVMQEDGFWERPDRFAILARYAIVDRVRAAAATAQALEGRLNRSLRGGIHSRSLAARLALQIHLVELGISDARTGTVADAVLTVQPALDAGADRVAMDTWCDELFSMYRKWSVHRNMHASEHRAGGQRLLVVAGFGAWATLGREAGLHVLDDDVHTGTRVVARVRVVADEPAGPLSQAQRDARWLGLVASAPATGDIVRRFRRGAAPLVRDARTGWRSGRIDLVLSGQFDLIEGSPAG